MSPANITLWARGTASDLESVPDTFSSWDKCMAKSYCNCCCPSGRRRNKTPKHFDDFHQSPPAPNPVYQPPPAPPSYRGAQQSAPSFRSAQQTAHFDAPKSPAHVNEDALPEMPTWAGAVDKHVEDPNHRDDVEMEPLNPPDRKQAGTPGVAYTDYSPNPTMGAAAAGYRGFGPTDPRARRSPGPGAALNPIQDPYGRRSPGTPSPRGAIDPYGRRSPGPAALSAAQDPYGRRSPGPAALAATQDPYGRRSPGMSPAPAAGYGAAAHDLYGSRSPGVTSPVGAPVHNPYDQQQYQDSYDDHSYGAGNGYHAPRANGLLSIFGDRAIPAAAAPTPGFQRQPSFGSSQYPPTYTSQPPYRGFSPAPSSPPPAFSAASPSEYATYNPHANTIPIPEPDNTRPPSLLQSGKKPTVNASSNF
ncbi:hypothetical protein N7519_003872 [Penicillium mononematosum]|uniref:uncharacterized protein n=1 Tax=Penicillium mononematosum TaxID=268346 RepID=UPI002546E8CE|nr:uncharacterized protein N7519_003872 [Penicillium mononematosum]KAJ6188964.1 hypothetical protein N7519_003872 [Penicillium mononematosum]